MTFDEMNALETKARADMEDAFTAAFDAHAVAVAAADIARAEAMAKAGDMFDAVQLAARTAFNDARNAEVLDAIKKSNAAAGLDAGGKPLGKVKAARA